MIGVDMRAAAVVIIMELDPPGVHVVSTERVEVPETIDFHVVSTKPISNRSYMLYDAAERQHRLGYEPIDDTTDRVLVPTYGLPIGDAYLIAGICDDVGNAVTVRKAVRISGEDPFSLALGMRSVMILSSRHSTVMDVNDIASAALYIRPSTREPFTIRTDADDESA